MCCKRKHKNCVLFTEISIALVSLALLIYDNADGSNPSIFRIGLILASSGSILNAILAFMQLKRNYLVPRWLFMLCNFMFLSGWTIYSASILTTQKINTKTTMVCIMLFIMNILNVFSFRSMLNTEEDEMERDLASIPEVEPLELHESEQLFEISPNYSIPPHARKSDSLNAIPSAQYVQNMDYLHESYQLYPIKPV